ncbi:hypothetical protein [Thauera sp. SDU_THAU2]|uniref:hypothetical protein n=1 Tax=Thauera sp. SDU_THAU2 TaxID=3136633 RepID=UPI00311F6A81
MKMSVHHPSDATVKSIVEAVQLEFENYPHRREKFSPFMQKKTGSNYNVSGHNDHIHISVNDCFIETSGVCRYEYTLSVSTFDEAPLFNTVRLSHVGKIKAVEWKASEATDTAWLSLKVDDYTPDALKNNPSLKSSAKQIDIHISVNGDRVTVRQPTENSPPTKDRQTRRTENHTAATGNLTPATRASYVFLSRLSSHPPAEH